jgi:enamine deaminase RidA (YjgF/YER057c/UK114 family)
MKRATRMPPKGEGIPPTPERWRRGDIEVLPHAIADEAGRPARPYRKVDTLTAMLRRGTITAAMRQAGEDFHALFERATLDPLAVPDLARVRQGWRESSATEAQMAARERVWRALQAVGGAASPAGSCVWHVLGCEWTVKDWALRQGWGGRPLSQEQAAGVLVAALGVLAALFGV